MSLNTVLPLLKGLWASWGIQLLVAASVACGIVLALLGSRRKYMTWILARFLIWATYLLLSYFATLALGKLTVVRIDDPENPGHDVVLEGLLAPLLLIQLGYPDGITAYEVEDNRLGLRQMLNIMVTVGFVFWILIRCWDSTSLVSRLYFPLFVVGIGKSVGWVWVLHSVYDGNSSVTAEDIIEEAQIQRVFNEIPKDNKFDSAKDILKAYFRFDCLKPHLVNWLYHPLFISRAWMSIDDYPTNHAFTITEIELNLMFDVLYTKAPLLYTKVGLIGHFFGLFCLVSALCGFTIIFKNVFLIDMYVTYTYALLMAVTSLELYQVMVLPFSDWAVVKMSMNLKVPLFRRFLPYLADWCMKKKRWSRSIGQLNLLDRHLLYKDWWKPIGVVLDLFGKREIFWRYWLHSRQTIPSCLKALVVQKMTELEKKRHLLPFTERGKWTLETHGIQENRTLSNSIMMEFDKSIIIWHVATEILHLLESEKSEDARAESKLLSDYMIYLLALHPYMLSLTTADITLEHAFCTLRPWLRNRNHSEAISQLLSADGNFRDPMDYDKVTIITRNWHVLLEVQKLVVALRTMDNKWELISSIWAEMLCYAASNCPVYHHANLLRRGGELVTHVWLLLAHKTDKYRSSIPELPKDTANTSASAAPPPSGQGCSSCIRRFFLGKRDATNNIYDSRK
ncbi:uncharacterized protein LOC115663436 [Syzygium oleosum]|uniref:uncharacterized protein LOC115663436 n=1 Tax=Syzygium oleosum TaxID=219896 RepID=UPI0024BA3DBC|nr:uncharacterized protein LOC115663436 [Syzygium oleosum]XP_056166876.1 uncharacterized protein LOC115663436 [Syzygium oleosum]